MLLPLHLMLILFDYSIEVSVKNNSNSPLTDVRVIEVVPKEVAESASLILSDFSFNVLVDDPVLEFIVPSLAAGEETKILYSVDSVYDGNAALGWVEPVAFVFQEEGSEPGPVPEPEPTPEPAPEPTPEQPVAEEPQDLTLLFLLIIIVLAVAGYVYYSKYYKK